MASPSIVMQKHGSMFPRFDDGDTLVYLASRQVYRFHAKVLRKCSSNFAALLPESQIGDLCDGNELTSHRLLFRLNLMIDTSGHHHFTRVKFDPVECNALLKANESSNDTMVLTELARDYDNLFRAFYNEPLKIENDTLTQSLGGCKSLVDVAEDHDAVGPLSKDIEIALLRHANELFASIAEDPIKWMNFAQQAQSPTIFKDCLIHLVGKWKLLSPDEVSKLDSNVHKLCVQKHGEFQLRKQSMELKMLGHYPDCLRKDNVHKPHRALYVNDIYAWMALSMFRHWFSKNLCEGHGKEAKDGGFQFYSQMSRGCNTYMTPNQREAFHDAFPMTNKAKIRLQNLVESLKNEIQQMVAPLVENHTQLKHEEADCLPYLLSLRVREQDYPWTVTRHVASSTS